MITTLIKIGCIIFGIYFTAISIISYKNNSIKINGKILKGVEAKIYSLLFIFIGSMIIIIPLVMLIVNNGRV